MQSSHRFALAAILIASLLANAADADMLKVGDPAPPFTVDKWIKGEPVTKFEDGKIYVLEFWATWCAPCKATMPHLSELQKANPDVVFIAQDILEEDKERAEVEPFVKEMGEKMALRVATDDVSKDEGAMATRWVKASGEEALPRTFVVDSKGKIAWIGKPLDVGPVIEQLKAGTFDQASATTRSAEVVDEREEARVVQSEFSAKVAPLSKARDFAGAANAVDEIIAAHPNSRLQLLGVKFGVLLKGKLWDQAYAVADQMAAEMNNDAVNLNNLAWTIVDSPSIEKRDYGRAERYVTRSAELTNWQDATSLDTLARVHAEQGHYDKAVDIETKAVALADEQLKPSLEKSLEGYKAKLAGK